MLLADLVVASAAVAATRSRTRKVAALAAVLRAASPDDVEIAAAYLSGTLRQRRTGLGWRSLIDVPAPADVGTITLARADAAFEAISTTSGPGSQARRTALVDDLFAAATDDEQRFLRLLVTGELRQGALEGLMLEAVARAAGLPPAAVRRAAMFSGSTVPVAVAALTGGEAALTALGLEVGRPLRPMLASSAPDLAAALAKAESAGVSDAPVAVDRKLDGIRIQVHKYDEQVHVFTRTLEEVTDRMPEVVACVAALPARSIVLDGEAIALHETGRPRPFQETAARTATALDIAAVASSVPLTSYFFDLLHLDGVDLVDEPASRRFDMLDDALPSALIVPRVLTGDPEVAADFYAECVAAGHEGVVVKSLRAPYEAGRRGSGWVKVKPRHTLDLVVLAVEWGSGRRSGWLSNIHLGARDPATGGYVMLGKTFKGMTDEMLRWQTERFLALETSRSAYVVHLRPEQVVEVAFDGLQTSTRYPGGLALRFARVLRYRDDKSAEDADTIATVRALHAPQAGSPPADAPSAPMPAADSPATPMPSANAPQVPGHDVGGST